MTIAHGIARVLATVMMNTTRLETIANRQRTGRVRDLCFAALVVFAGAMSLMGVSKAVQAAQVTHVAHR
jgi:hypothetical protein